MGNPTPAEFIERCIPVANRILREQAAANSDVAVPLTMHEQKAVNLGILSGIQAAFEVLDEIVRGAS